MEILRYNDDPVVAALEKDEVQAVILDTDDEKRKVRIQKEGLGFAVSLVGDGAIGTTVVASAIRAVQTARGRHFGAVE